MKDIGKKISNMEKVKKPGLTKQITKVTMSKGKSMAKENSHGQMVLSIREIFVIIISRDMVYTNGLTVESLKVNGVTIKCTVSESSRGLMAGDTMVSILMIKSRATAPFIGQTVENT